MDHLEQGLSHSNPKLDLGGDDVEEVNDSPIEEVRLTVSVKDDPSEQALTFRTWVLGLISCCTLSFVNQFFSYRENMLSISYLSVQIVAFPIGKLMAAVLPTRKFFLPFTNWGFSLNPCPFNMKEHVLITIFAGAGSGGVYALNIVTIMKAFYHKNLNFVGAMLLAQTTQLLGYGWAGLFRRYLVESPYMWWPSNLVQVSLFRALHEKEKRSKGDTTRVQFFLIVFITSCAYYVVPGYLFPSISNLALLCWIFKDSVIGQMVGSARHGFGIGSFGLDWATFSFIGNPLANPFFTIANTMVGFVLFFYVLIPIAYSFNAYEAKRFPLLSSKTFDANGQKYNITAILNQATFDFDRVGYDGYSKLYMSITFAFLYGFSFAYLMASLSHVALFDGNTIWEMWKKTKSTANEKMDDVHTRMMKKYKQVPQWWFQAILVISLALSLYACEGFGKQLQLPWWGLLLACAIAFIFTLPVGIIQATTNMQPGLNVITELIIGYIYPGRPLANVSFKTYGYISMAQALNFVQDFKLGHYMKIPPRSMFVVQLTSTIVASTSSFFATWWLLSSVPYICDDTKLPLGSPWTCPGYDVFYSASIIWGVIGPGRMFTSKGIYPGMNWFFLIGILAPVPVWWLARKFPDKKWIRNIHMPMLIGAAQSIPPAGPVHYWTWGAIGTLFNYYIYNKYKTWWARYNYVLSAALGAGVAFMGILLFFALQSKNIAGPDWWGLDVDDHCPLAVCPTAPGVVVKGCPTF